MITKPMLAGTLKDRSKIKFPVIASPKLDGIRCLMVDGAKSRTFKDIPNHHIRKELADLPDGLDGELISGKTFQDCTGNVMREDSVNDFEYWVFDWVQDDPKEEYIDRLGELISFVKNRARNPHIRLVPTVFVMNNEELEKYEQENLDAGYEGTMIRSLEGPYKFGRSTEKQGYLLKIKPFVDSECEVIGFIEMLHNENKAEKDNFGRTKRSSAKAGKVPAGKLGKFLVRNLSTDKSFPDAEFSIGTGEGLTMELRQEIWDNQGEYLGKLIKYKYQLIGSKDAPRIPIFLGFRDKRDM